MARFRSYVVELESAPLPCAPNDDDVKAFSDSLRSNRRLAEATPSVDLERHVLELSTRVKATGPASALATVEVAVLTAAMKARLRAEVTVANVWLDDEANVWLDDENEATLRAPARGTPV